MRFSALFLIVLPDLLLHSPIAAAKSFQSAGSCSLNTYLQQRLDTVEDAPSIFRSTRRRSRRQRGIVRNSGASAPTLASIPSSISINSGANYTATASSTNASVFPSISSLIARADAIWSTPWLADPEISIRVLMLLYYASIGALMPYYPVFYKSLGLSSQEIGFLGAISPLMTLLMSPLWGALADTTQKHKEIMILTFAGSICARLCFVIVPKHSHTLALLVALSSILSAPVRPLMDAMAMKALKTKTMYGRARLFGQIGFGLGSYMSGLTMGASMTNIFLVHALLAVPTIAIMMHQSTQSGNGSNSSSTLTDAATASTNPSTKAPSAPSSVDAASSPTPASQRASLGMDHLMLHLGPRARNALAFFTVVFVVGTASGVIENFAFNRISQTAPGGDIGGYLGLFTLLSSSCGAPMFWLSGKLIERVGVNAILAAALGAYTTRFFIYSFITAPWQAIPAEILRGMTFAAFWAASTYYVFKISPPGHTATMLGLLNGIYAGLGQSVGSLVGGHLSAKHGIAGAFKRFGGVTLTSMILFIIATSLAP